MNPSINENTQHNCNSLSRNIQTLGIYTTPSSPEKNRSFKKIIPNYTSQIFHISHTLTSIIRKVFKEPFEKIKENAQYVKKCEDKVKQRANSKDQKYGLKKERSLSADGEKKTSRAKLLTDMLENLKKKKADEQLNLNKQNQNQFNSSDNQLQTIIEKLNSEHHQNNVPENPQITHIQKKYIKKQKITQTKITHHHFSTSAKKTSKSIQTKSPESSPLNKVKSKVEFQYVSPNKPVTHFNYVSPVTQEYGMGEIKNEMMKANANNVNNKLMNLNIKQIETGSYISMHEEQAFSTNNSSRNTDKLIKHKSQNSFQTYTNLTNNTNQTNTTNLNSNNSSKKKIKVISQLPYRKKSFIILGSKK